MVNSKDFRCVADSKNVAAPKYSQFELLLLEFLIVRCAAEQNTVNLSCFAGKLQQFSLRSVLVINLLPFLNLDRFAHASV
jgi:hypothetical protein